MRPPLGVRASARARLTCEWVVPRLPGEADASHAVRSGRIYFEAQERENAEWWRRIGTAIDLTGKRVLEIGCGHGALCLDAVTRGAAQVTGVDLDAGRVRVARDHLQTHHPRHSASVRFLQAPVDQLLVAETFDVDLSKDTFEHVQELDRLLVEVARRLCRFQPAPPPRRSSAAGRRTGPPANPGGGAPAARAWRPSCARRRS